jgi:gliding motility-associated-like protein
MKIKAVIFLLLLLAKLNWLNAQVIDTAVINMQQVRYGIAFNVGSTYVWQVQDGSIVSGAFTNEIYVNWGSVPGLKRIAVVETNATGCESDTNIAFVLLVTDTLTDSLICMMPNAFSPNGDGLNDVFGFTFPISDLNEFKLAIYNRWGDAVFMSNDPLMPWDGTTNGNPCAMDVYVWKLEISRKRYRSISKHGTFTLLR